jgi:choline dehydrogenase
MAYIHRELGSEELKNLTIVNHALTRKVIIEDHRAIGVEFEINGQVQQARVTKEVLMAAGALETPKLLMLSGIGPESELKRFDIPVLLNQPAIGENLHDHPNVPVFFKGKLKVDFAYPQLYAFDRLNPHSKLASNTQADTCFAFFSAPITLHQSMHRMVPVLALPRSLYPIKPLRNTLRKLIDLAFKIPMLNKLIDRTYGIVVILGKPESRGRLRLQSANARDQAEIDPAYYRNDTDMETMIKGVGMIQKMAAQAGLTQWGSNPLGIGGRIKKPARVKKFIQNSTMTTFHFCGTCKMGDDLYSPVDSQLRLKGITGLRIADASVIPEIPVSAINAPSMMIGHRAADFILSEYQTNTKHSLNTTQSSPSNPPKPTSKASIDE